MPTIAKNWQSHEIWLMDILVWESRRTQERHKKKSRSPAHPVLLFDAGGVWPGGYVMRGSTVVPVCYSKFNIFSFNK
jgi:hypothetical protein